MSLCRLSALIMGPGVVDMSSPGAAHAGTVGLLKCGCCGWGWRWGPRSLGGLVMVAAFKVVLGLSSKGTPCCPVLRDVFQIIIFKETTLNFLFMSFLPYCTTHYYSFRLPVFRGQTIEPSYPTVMTSPLKPEFDPSCQIQQQGAFSLTAEYETVHCWLHKPRP